MGGPRLPSPPQPSGLGLKGPCVLFPGKARGGQGSRYGVIRVDGRQTTAHRFSFVSAYGPIDDRLQVDHLCLITLCWMPDHLEAVSGTENRRRAGQVKLTEEDVRCIRRLGSEGWAFTAIGAAYGISNVQAANIVKMKHWRWVQ